MTSPLRQQTDRYAAYLGIALLAVAAITAALNPATWNADLDTPVMDGEWATAYGKNFDKTLALTQPAKDAFGTLSYMGFGEGRPGVLVGRDGWLFTDEEMAKLDTPGVAIGEKIAFIRASITTAEAAGAKVAVVLIPAKLRIYGEYSGRYGFMPKLQPVYGEAVSDLRKSGVSVIDLRSAFAAQRSRTQLFLKTDTHWTPEGAGVAAQEIVRWVSQSGALTGDQMQSNFVLKTGGAKDHRGDLLSFLPVLPSVRKSAPQPDRIRTGEAQLQATGGAAQDDALLGDAQVPVALVGSSYSFDPRWQFEDQLKVLLHADVLNAAQEGQGPFKPMADYLKAPAFKDAPPTLILWEIPERYLWSTAALPKL